MDTLVLNLLYMAAGVAVPILTKLLSKSPSSPAGPSPVPVPVPSLPVPHLGGASRPFLSLLAGVGTQILQQVVAQAAPLAMSKLGEFLQGLSQPQQAQQPQPSNGQQSAQPAPAPASFRLPAFTVDLGNGHVLHLGGDSNTVKVVPATAQTTGAVASVAKSAMGFATASVA